MSNEEAKFLLNACRPSGRDAADPNLAAALEQARRDAALGRWLERQQAHDKAIAGKLAEIGPPAGLRDAILAGARASRRESTRLAVWRRPAWLAAAAAIAVLLGLTQWRTAVPASATLEGLAVAFVDHGFRLEKRGADVAELRAWLAERGGPLPTAVPAEFMQLRALGCRTLDLRGREVSLVCFERGGKEYHLFVARGADFPEIRVDPEPRFRTHGKLIAAAWSDVKAHYVVVSDADLPALRRVL